jgi:hypothetical protein
MSTGTTDYTRQTAADEADSFQIGRVKATKTAEQIEQESADREFRQIDPGDHLLIVAGFVKKPEPKQRTAYVDGSQRQYTVYSVGVRLARADDPQAQTVEWLDLPPYEPADMAAYLYGSKGPDGKNAGFHAAKFFQFVGRLNPAWHVEPGEELPDDALMLGNWKGRKVVATIETGKPDMDPATRMPKINPNTGLPFEPRNQVKLFSYRAATDGAAVALPAANPGQPITRVTAGPAGATVATGSAPAAGRPGLRRSI